MFTLLVYFVSGNRIAYLYIFFQLFGHLGTVCRSLSIRNSAECCCWGSALKAIEQTLIVAFIGPVQNYAVCELETVHFFYNGYSLKNLYITSAIFRIREIQFLTCFLWCGMALSQPI
jgi:hypothetical protein